MSTAVSTPRDHRHDHVVGFYVRDSELIAAVASFVTGALAEGGAAVMIATAPHLAAVDAALVEHGYSPDELAQSGRLRALDAADTLALFMRDGRPDRRAFESAIEPVLDALAAVGSPVRAFGEMVALLWDAGNVAAAIELEALWNDVIAARDFALFCAYPMTSVDDVDDLRAAQHVCQQHSNVIALDDLVARSLGSEPTELGTGFDRTFIATPSAPIRVRAFVREVLDRWEEDALFGVAGVVAAELATNAMVHARSPFRVSMTRSPTAVRIAVRDASTDQPEHLERDNDRTGGRGIAIVAALSRAWGTERDATGKVVWAELARDVVRAD